jgi:hypothetical protein
MQSSFARFLLMGVISLSWHVANAQHHSCLYKNLSTLYDYAIAYDRALDSRGVLFVKPVQISIIQKSTNNVIQRIKSSFNDGNPSGNPYNCTSRSFVTGYRKDTPAVDGDFGIDSIQHTLSLRYYVGANPGLTERIYR